jgi:hypothetical protein
MLACMANRMLRLLGANIVQRERVDRKPQRRWRSAALN